MTRIDRYILVLYLRVLLICFASVCGLLIVVEVFTNLDEFVRYGAQSGRGLLAILVEYFIPRIIEMFEGLSGLLALLALLFVIAWLNKTHEFTALLAAGVTKRRVIKPLLAASAVVVLGAASLREIVIPAYQDRLSLNPQELTGEVPRSMRPLYDPSSMVLIQGLHLLPAQRLVVEPSLKVYGGPLSEAVGNKLVAKTAVYQAETPNHAAGYLLSEVTQPTDIASIASVQVDGQDLLLTPAGADWLAPNQCFIASSIEYEALRGGAWKKHASTFALVQHLRGESDMHSSNVRVQIHQRLLRPVVDWTVLLLGIPVLLTRPDRHMFWVAGACLGIVTGFTAIVLGVAALGSSSGWISPALSIWLPLIVFTPWAWAKTQHAMET